MRNINISLFVLLFSLLGFIQAITHCQDFCQTCGTGYIYNDVRYNWPSGNINFLECTLCVSDPNRSENTDTCKCDKGYFYDGTKCRKQEPGIIHKEDFETANTLSVNWTKRDSQPTTSSSIVHNAVLNSNVVTFSEKRNGGDIYSLKAYSGLKYDEKAWVIFDYNVSGSTSYLYFAVGIFGKNGKNYKWRITNNSASSILKFPSTVGTKWNHAEVQLDIWWDNIPQVILIEDSGVDGTPSSGVFLDNIVIASTHGPNEYNVNPYSILYPSFMVQSVDYIGYDGTNNLQQFNFDITIMDSLLGGTTWDNQQYAVYISEKDIVAEVTLYRSSNGGTIGDGYGRFTDNTSYQTDKFFYPGQHLNFDVNFSQNQADFFKWSGTSKFDGPLLDSAQNLGTCSDDCRDFETLELAMIACWESSDCNGVTYSHKLWGGPNSQGYAEGYGYQLRKTGTHTAGRKFEFSYSKRATEDFTNRLQVLEKCKRLSHSVINPYQFDSIYIRKYECQECRISTDPNRSNISPSCSCNKGYYDDGIQCQPHTIGVIYEDDFNSGLLIDKWQGSHSDGNTISATLNPGKYSSDQCVEFTTLGDLFFKKTYQTLDFSQEAIVMFDYISEGNTGLQVGFSEFYPEKNTWLYTSSVPDTGSNPLIPKTTASWNHIEARITVNSENPFKMVFQEHVQASSESFIDNFVLSSIHGPSEIRETPYKHLQPAMMILGNDFTGFTGSPSNQQFNFNLPDLEAIFGRPAVNEEKLFVYLERMEKTVEVQFFINNSNNGGIFGNAYGKFVDPTPYNSELHFKPGDWIIFSNNLATSLSDFKLETGTCLFQGPLRAQNQNLENCFQNCKDFNTLEEAMEECIREDLCDGVTYSHKLWGGSASTGFHRGYGYQLRTTGATPARDFSRDFEYSFQKNLIQSKTQHGKEIQCRDCQEKCLNCKIQLDQCFGCFDSISRDSSNNCACQDGYFETNQPSCESCNMIKCSTCDTNSDNCLVCSHANRDIGNSCNCRPTFFENNTSQCGNCNPIKCITCTSNADNCETCSHTNRDVNNNCQCKPGFFENNTSQCGDCNLIKCATCSTNADRCDTCSHSTRDPENNCNCKTGFYDIGTARCTENCDLTKCSSCHQYTSNCISCSHENREFSNNCQCKIGFYDNGTPECAQCDNCPICDSTGTCTNCVIGKYLDSDQQCQNCHEKCLTCASFNTCQVCSSKGEYRSYNISNNCGCQDGYYEIDSNINCIPCNVPGCKTCNSEGICLECQDSTLTLPNCQKNKPGFFTIIEDSGNEVVEQCNIQCSTCNSNRNNCDFCSLGSFRQTSNPCTCKAGYHDNHGRTQDCQKCPKYCKSCISSEECLECIDSDNMELNSYSRQCECKTGFKINIQTDLCEKCYNFKGECLFQCPNTTNKNEDKFHCEEKSFLEKSNIALIWICCLILVLSILIVNLISSKYKIQRPSSNQKITNPQEN